MPNPTLFMHASLIIFLVFLNHLSFCQDIEFPAERKGRINFTDGTTENFNRLELRSDSLTCFLKNDIVLQWQQGLLHSSNNNKLYPGFRIVLNINPN